MNMGPGSTVAGLAPPQENIPAVVYTRMLSPGGGSPQPTGDAKGTSGEPASTKEGEDGTEELAEQPFVGNALAGYIWQSWARNKRARDVIEERLLACLRARRGVYSAAETQGMWTADAGELIYLPLAATKMRSAEAALSDLLLPQGDRPWGLTPTPLPSLPPEIEDLIAKEAAAQARQQMESIAQQEGGQVMDPDQFRAIAIKLQEQMRDSKLEEEKKEAKSRAERMEDVIEDRMEEGRYYRAMAEFVQHFCTYPAAVFKGPFLERGKRMKWGRAPYTPEVTNTPIQTWMAVNPFDCYPAPEAETCQDGDFIERIRMGRRDLYDCIGQPGYNEVAIRNVLAAHSTGSMRAWLWSDAERRSLEGMAQPLSAMVLTPSGFKKMGDIAVGDAVIDPMGEASQVLGVYPSGVRKVYSVQLADGSKTEACEKHLWQVETKDFDGIINTLSVKKMVDDGVSVRVPRHVPVVYQDGVELPLHPYLLGYLIGNGCFRCDESQVSVSSIDADALERMRNFLPHGLHLVARAPNINGNIIDYGIVAKIGRKANPLFSALRALQLSNTKSQDKFIPSQYLYASVDQRIELLRGLMDSDGSVDQQSRAEFCTSSEQLAKDVQQLIRSIGGRVNIYPREGKELAINSRVCHSYGSFILRNIFTGDINPFWISRKANRFQTGRPGERLRRIVSVEYLREEPVQCIKVSAASSLYITDDYIPTHNTHDVWIADHLVDAVHFWGSVEGQILIEYGLTDGVEDPLAYYEVDAVLIGTEVIRCEINDDPLGRRPYFNTSYDPVPGAFWGNSIYELMRDCQAMVNACARALNANLGFACLTADTVVYRHPKAGRKKWKNSPISSRKREDVEVTIGQLWDARKGLGRQRFRCLNEKTGQFFGNKVVGIFDNGVQPVYRVKTENGYEIKATANHRFMCADGEYQTLDRFTIGDPIAVNGRAEPLIGTCMDCGARLKSPVAVRCRSCNGKTKYKPAFCLDCGKEMGESKSSGAKRCQPCYVKSEIAQRWNRKQAEEALTNRDASESTARGRKLVRNQLADACLLCLATEDLHLHHIDRDPLNCDPENTLTLCEPCHKWWHMRNDHMGDPCKHVWVDYDLIVSIEYVGEERVFDLSMKAPFHNFVANGFVSHNSGPMCGIDMSQLAAGQDPKAMRPLQIWQLDRSRAQAAAAPIEWYQADSRATELLGIIKDFEQKADDLTGLPRYLNGVQDASGAASTSSGLSMLMSTAAKGLRRAVSNIDREVIARTVEAAYVHEMLYNPDDTIKGDCAIEARGAAAVLIKEHLQQTRTQFLAMTANPIDMDIIGTRGRRAVLKEVAQSLEMPVDEIVGTDQEFTQKQETQQQTLPQPKPDTLVKEQGAMQREHLKSATTLAKAGILHPHAAAALGATAGAMAAPQAGANDPNQAQQQPGAGVAPGG